MPSPCHHLLPHLLLCAVKKASVLCPAFTRTYSCVGLNSHGMSSATSVLNHTVTSRLAAALQHTAWRWWQGGVLLALLGWVWTGKAADVE